MNYIGSKLSLIDYIVETVKEETGLSSFEGMEFADLFAGTGIVGQTFKSQGAIVTANDIQFFSYVLNKHLIENTEKSDVNYGLVDQLNNLPEANGFIYQNYCPGSGSNRNYFTDSNGRKCDAIRQELENLKNARKINNGTYYMCLASLINSMDKCANTASVYGAFLKHVKKSAQKPLTINPLPIVPGPTGKVFCADINMLVKNIKGDVLYLDPPYNRRQYSSNYHVLETLARYDEPELKGVSGLRANDEQKSLYCSLVKVSTAFEDLIKNAQFKYIFLSYNNEGLMSTDTIKEIMSKYGKYICHTKEYHRFKADKDINRNIKADSTIEYLHCLKK